MLLIISCSLDRLDKTSSEVEYCPVLVFFGFETNFSLSNKISPSCFGELRLNSSPDFSKIPLFNLSSSDSNTLSKLFKYVLSMLIPSFSISARTRIIGTSISQNISSTWFVFISSSKICFN